MEFIVLYCLFLVSTLYFRKDEVYPSNEVFDSLVISTRNSFANDSNTILLINSL